MQGVPAGRTPPRPPPGRLPFALPPSILIALLTAGSHSRPATSDYTSASPARSRHLRPRDS